jgi:hypothetical protein
MPLLGGALGLRLPGVTPPPGVVGVPGASGGFTPGGEELDGGVVDGVRVDGVATDGDVEDWDVEGGAAELGAVEAAPGGAAPGDWPWAAAAAANPSAVARRTGRNVFMRAPLENLRLER